MSIYQPKGNQSSILGHLLISKRLICIALTYLLISGHRILLLWLISSRARVAELDISLAWLSDYLDDIRSLRYQLLTIARQGRLTFTAIRRRAWSVRSPLLSMVSLLLLRCICQYISPPTWQYSLLDISSKGHQLSSLHLWDRAHSRYPRSSLRLPSWLMSLVGGGHCEGCAVACGIG
jgi:hypothetical protein